MTSAHHKRAGVLFGAGGIAAVALALVGGPKGVRRHIQRLRDDHTNRPALWNRFYAFDWGETTTNNYGFAPAEGDHPQRFQHQIYRELLGLLSKVRPITGGMKLLEVSCGLGGGLAAFRTACGDGIDATGLDVAKSAIDLCRKHYGENDHLRFQQGSALHLPFPDASFDVVLNVEASNDYGDRPSFFREVARVLKGNGVFLYTDNFRRDQVGQMQRELEVAGLRGHFRDVTANVAEACRLDTPRRLQMIERAPLLIRLLLRRELGNYAGVEGSRKYRSFAEGRRIYLMTAALKG